MVCRNYRVFKMKDELISNYLTNKLVLAKHTYICIHGLANHKNEIDIDCGNGIRFWQGSTVVYCLITCHRCLENGNTAEVVVYIYGMVRR